MPEEVIREGASEPVTAKPEKPKKPKKTPGPKDGLVRVYLVTDVKAVTRIAGDYRRTVTEDDFEKDHKGRLYIDAEPAEAKVLTACRHLNS